MLDLKTFISESIKDIFDGVIEAQEYAKIRGGFVNVYDQDCMRRIDYDIAVSTVSTKTKATQGKAKIFIAEASLLGDSKKEDSAITRMKFTILVEMPNKKKIRKNASSPSLEHVADMLP